MEWTRKMLIMEILPSQTRIIPDASLFAARTWVFDELILVISDVTMLDEALRHRLMDHWRVDNP